ncbi:MAG: hypothetical protein WDO18_18220 [Acidobacteriota bacterium]
MKAAALKATADSKTDDEKATALVAYVQQHVRDVNDDSVSEAERTAVLSKLPKDRRRNAVEVFKGGIGVGEELNSVFAAMASTLGLDARPAYVANKTNVFFDPASMPDTYFLRFVDIAVKIGDGWKIYDPASKLVSPGMVTSGEEGMTALISDPKKPTFLIVPYSAPSASKEARTATLRLNAEGTLEGDVVETYTGHRAREYRLELDGNSSGRQEELLKDRLKNMFPDSEVTAIAFENITNTTLPLKVSYHLHAPLYAQGAGRRMFFPVFPFQRAETSPFSAAERRHPIMFPYAWEESDDLSIQLPPGTALDSADSPGAFDFLPAGKLSVDLAIRSDGVLTVKRQFLIGDKGNLFFDAKNYKRVQTSLLRGSET